VANGQTNTITLHTNKDWVLEPFEDPASKNTPPVIRFDPTGGAFTGPPVRVAATFTTSQPDPLALTAWVTDEPAKLDVGNALLIAPPDPAPAGSPAAPRPNPISVTWSLFRGPGSVTFDNAKPAVNRTDNGKTTASATFSAPGEYILRLQANDSSGEGGGGFQCCWTNAHVAVSVK
jgi:hypothetical protein